MNQAQIVMRLESLRHTMSSENVDIYLCTVGDHHMSEYVCDYFKVLEFFSGFSGSRATLMVTSSEAFLFTDGRYFLEAEEVLRGTGITLMREGVKDVPSLKELLSENLQSSFVVGLDSRYFSISTVKCYINICAEHDAIFNTQFSEPEKLMVSRASLPETALYVLEDNYCGMSAIEKLEAIRVKMKESNCNTHIICDLSEIAYILNLRGSDIPYNPLFLSYLVINMNYAVLYISPKSISLKIRDYLSRIGVIANSYIEFYSYVRKITSKSILLDEARVNYALFEAIGKKNRIYSQTGPATVMKSIKNSVEQDNLRKANILDGIAFVKFLYDLENKHLLSKTLHEKDCADLLKEKRQMSKQYISESFAPIVAAGSNAAIVHYEHKGSGNDVSSKDAFLLVDTGGHYLLGTTDVTRTLVIGEPDNEQKEMYTRVLKSNISIAEAVFKKGTTGAGLDILARRELWKDGLDYRHGTGHGIGYLLSVHEGPFSLSYNSRIQSNLIPLEPGMVMSDEPGYYKDGEYGIRLENDLLVVPFKETVYGEFYKFEVLTLVPFDPKAIDFSLISPEEKTYIKNYHNRILETLSHYMSDEESAWFIARFITPLL